MMRQGGPIAMRETERHRAQMEAAAADLPALPLPASESPLRFHLLTGRRFWYQTMFCLHSLVRAIGEPLHAVVNDDGTLDSEHVRRLERLGPAVRIRLQSDIVARLDRHLPIARFPVLRELWRSFVLIRKLTDVHAGNIGWQLFVDSDLLFFRRPDFLLDWLVSPDRPLHAVDCTESYGYSRALMERLAGAPIPPLVNTGLCGLNSDTLDWPLIEAWCRELIARERRHYYLEQALVAMLSARAPSRAFAPAGDYVTLPGRAEVEDPRAVMHHYVAESKRWYFRRGWRHVVGTADSMR
jgi:hypothetical protein